MRTIFHRAGIGKLGWLDACTNTPLVHFRSMVMQIKYSMQWVLKEAKEEQGFQVAFTKIAGKTLPEIFRLSMVKACTLHWSVFPAHGLAGPPADLLSLVSVWHKWPKQRLRLALKLWVSLNWNRTEWGTESLSALVHGDGDLNQPLHAHCLPEGRCGRGGFIRNSSGMAALF